ncbi:hypothetical protein P1X14_17725 [Sphingomonas sp. AOB5]|uniref:hypothetical protein n=1 Tax=Sphingomonas sp. AOB5 TaxID=3034017 RepID=UPI0023F6E710|nr:hypothetical protein [Sphingomonas sp. AOB5]MDF7777102.1 hypothetical protein [Sphingomonas sp. AOB5]
MKRFSLVMWCLSLSLLVLMLGMYLGNAGVLAGSRQEQLVLREGGIAVRYDGKARPNDPAPITVTLCRYWKGFRVAEVLIARGAAPCPLIHGLS